MTRIYQVIYQKPSTRYNIRCQSVHNIPKAEPIQYGATIQTAVAVDSALLKTEHIRCIQEIVGILLYCSRVVNPTLAQSLSLIALQQVNGTKKVKKACHQLLDYVVTHPNTSIQYVASNTILQIHQMLHTCQNTGGESSGGRQLP